MKTWIMFWAGAITALFGLLFWRNSRIYGRKSPTWRLAKSMADLVLIAVSAARLPALLVAWCVMWVTRPIENPVVKTTTAVISGLLFGLLGVSALELLIVCSVFSIDLVTGRDGFLKNWYKAGREEEVQALAA